RLEALQRYEILDTMPEREFDDIAFLAAQICQAPVALITFIDSHRQWFKARVGLDMIETPRDISFCAHAIAQAGPLIISDATQDARFAANPLVTGERHVRFYSGAPLVTPDGQALGTLCVLDIAPRQLTPDQQEALSRLSRQVVAQLELRRSLLRLQRTVSERNEALSAQRHSERLRQAIVEHASDGIITVEEQGRIQTCNEAASQMFGVPAEVLIGQSVQEWIVELDSVVRANTVREFMRSGRTPSRAEHQGDAHDLGWLAQSALSVQPVGESAGKSDGEPVSAPRVRELTLRRPDGESVQVEWSISETEFDGQLVFIALLRDISERRRTDRLKTEFISTVSHELRTPLTSIHGSLSLLRGGVGGPSHSEAMRAEYAMPDGARMLLDIACNNSERLVRLINDILDISKIEAGRMEFNLQPLELRSFLRGALDANRAYGAGFGVQFELEDVPAGLNVVADSDRLMQVMTNLLSNAAKFTQRNDTIIVSVTRHMHSGAAAAPGSASHPPVKFARVAVCDHGPGIREEFHNRVFQKFAQADSSNTRQKGGTGLGLSISKAIIERMGGHIGFTTRPANTYADPSGAPFASSPALEGERSSRGTTFFFDLPEFVLPESPRQPDQHSHSDGASGATQSTSKSSEAPQLFSLYSRRATLLNEGRVPAPRAEAAQDDPSTLIASQSDNAAHTSTKASAPERMTSSQGEDRPSILICEDDADVASVLARMLQMEGFETEIVPDGASARARLAERTYNAMTLDLGLPDGDGIALIRKLRLRDDTRDMPIVVVSAHADRGFAGSAHEQRQSGTTAGAEPLVQIGGDALGVVDWLDKPIDQQRLRSAVLRAVNNNSKPGRRQPGPLILHVEDDPDILQLLSLLLSDVAQVRYAMSLQEARRLLGEESFDLVILDLTLPDGSGLDLLPLLHRGHSQTTDAPATCVSPDAASGEGAAEPVPVVIFSASEIDNDTARRVSSVLTKSRHSHRDLLEIIRRLVPRRDAAGGEQGL
ncbi:MAG: hypothetical protein JWN98_2555, partial [Abditibacteriota bacterium]|nr:hypothetical protein [Abditibacteriota bacterium]